ncbi:MAG: phosphodiesterase, partial [Mycetocola sp.]
SIHDLDDFYRAGVLQQTSVSGELRSWLRDAAELAQRSDAELRARSRTPGHGLEMLWRRIQRKDAWSADPDAFRLAGEQVSIELGDTLLAIPFDGGSEAERAITAFTGRWLDRFKGGITVDERPSVRSGFVRLSQQSWHDVNVLKFVHSRFVLDRPDLATVQRGQGTVIETLVSGFNAWLQDRHDSDRAPRRLLESMEVAIDDYSALRREYPEVLSGPTDDASIIRRGRSRAVIDYVASLSDSQALSIASTISGSSDRLWSTGGL